jgi:16S rRNA (guanine966-N2)-methyltransferase
MGSLRVIGGERRGFRLVSPRGSTLRPTSGRVREALFDILGKAIEGTWFLDLFAGTGAVGIEALSRGAFFSVFLEENRSAAKAIHRNLEICGFEDRGRVVLGRIPAALSRLTGEAGYGVVFVDPPYESRAAGRTLEVLGWSGILAAGAKVVVEHRRSWDPPSLSGRLLRRRSVRHGDTVLSFFEMADREAGAQTDIH